MNTISDENNEHIIDESESLLTKERIAHSTGYRIFNTNDEINNNNCSCATNNSLSLSNKCNKKRAVGEQNSENNHYNLPFYHNDNISAESFIYTSLEDKVKKKDTNFKINISPYSCSEQVFLSTIFIKYCFFFYYLGDHRRESRKYICLTSKISDD